MVSTRRKQQKPSTDRQRWEVIFKALKQLLQRQKLQLDSLFQERIFLQKRSDLHYQRCNSDAVLLQSHVSELREQLEVAKLARWLEIAKAKLLVGSKKKKAFGYKHKLDDTTDELDDYRAWFDILSHRCPDQEDIAPDWLYEILSTKGGKDSSPGAASEKHKMLEKEVATLKREYEKLSLRNSDEVSSLRSEIKFAWNQYNEKEGHFTRLLQAKNDEINKANEKITTLLATLEQLQMSNSVKDQTVNKLVAEAREKDEIISRCSKELDMFRFKRPVGRPPLKRCSAEPSACNSERSRTSRNEESPDLEEGSSASLRAKLNKLEVEVNLKNEEIASLSEELNLLRSKTVVSTPVLRGCTRDSSSYRLRSQGNGSSRAVPKEEVSSAQLVSEKGSKRPRRQQEDVITIEDETPRLFTSQFKIPKLKNSQSPRTR
ncbi:uncharacterized protein LOC141586419 [Silene latifolia]|uniref:uncharacterized protein LOC141586419 n=1 Tax=Silene latifolia TaxID=37657 RepID=UPI003D787E67